jgi:flagellar hook assembly protein FlgD
MGQKVNLLFDGSKEAGVHTVQWDGKNQNGQFVSTGLYFCRMQAGEFVKTVKIISLH